MINRQAGIWYLIVIAFFSVLISCQKVNNPSVSERKQNNSITESGGGKPDQAPPVFSGLSSASKLSDVAVTLAWVKATDNLTPQYSIKYLVFQSTTSLEYSFSSPVTTVLGIDHIIVTGLTPNTPYYFTVRAQDEAGNTDNNTVEKSAMTGVQRGIITTIAGTGVAGYSGDGGPATDAQLNYPHGLAMDAAGNIYIADVIGARIRKIDAMSGNITTVGNCSGSLPKREAT